MRIVNSLVGRDGDGNAERPTSRRQGLRSSVANKLRVAAATTSTAADPNSSLVRIPARVEQVLEGEKWGTWWPESNGEEGEQQQQTQRSEKRNRESVSDSGCTSRSISFTLSNPDVLDCPMCFLPLSSTVYQCENGHVACASCCTKMKNICATCCRPIGYNRCRAAENIVESVRVTCGCKETFSYSKKLAHEKTCNYTSCSCPLSGCGYVGISASVYAHFALSHPCNSKKFHFNETIFISLDKKLRSLFLQEGEVNTLFILNHFVKADGSFVNVVCVAPNSEERSFLYDLRAAVGKSSIKLKSSADNMPKWLLQPPNSMCLVVPSHSIGSCGEELKL